MNIKKTRILGSDYVGLFSITNESLCFVPAGIESATAKIIEKTLNVKTVQTSIYDSSLLAVFAKMNNKEIFLPKFANPKEIELIEKEIKVPADAKGVLDVLLRIEAMVYLEELSCAADLLNPGYRES